MPAPDAVRELVQIYRDNAADYRKSDFNEHQTRVQFINPFWKALGWDVDNAAGFAEAYKDVINEAALKVGGSTKAPDYSFGIAQTRKFFLEAKKPAVNLEADNDPAYQLRRYAYTAKFALSVLTNFRQLAVYDGKIAPNRADLPPIARLKFYTLDQYDDKWDEIAGLLSREAILKGAFDRFAAAKTKRGTVPVDVAFLREIEGWRLTLARDIAAKNSLSTPELNLAVGRIIDRIIFLRICEENGIEPGAPLLALKSGVNLYSRLVALFRSADARYNSGLFHFDPNNKRGEAADEITPVLTVSNASIKTILARLYYPETPYAFDALPLDILGQIYERFLGKVIVLSGKKADVEEKPEVRKAGGVYYTPSYIVDYIVAQTVGKLLENRAPTDSDKIKVLDPACGSGSFLLGAYDYLLKWHLQWYLSNEPKKWAKKAAPPIYQVISPPPHNFITNYRLTARERKRIALDHIFGVDLDAQAVEVTKFSLALKVLEGETAENIDNALKNHNERGLPDLGRNIKCGNSLIEPDFYSPADPNEWQRRNNLDDQERARINDFNWRAEFAAVFKSGGFDAVIGNPPYVQARSGQLAEMDKAYFETKFKTAEYQLNLYALFLERGVTLLRKGGLMGFIVPNYWLSTDYDARLREFLFRQNQVRELVNVYKVFEDATVDTLVIIAAPGQGDAAQTVAVKSVDRVFKSIAQRLDAVAKREFAYQKTVQISELPSDVRLSFSASLELQGEKTLADFCIAKFGMKPYQQGKGKPSQTREMVNLKAFNSKTQENDSYKPLLRAGGVQRYFLNWEGDWIDYGAHLAEPRSPELFSGPRLLLQRIVSRPRLDGTWTDGDFVCNTDVITLKLRLDAKDAPDLKFIAGILFSSLCGFVIKSRNVNLDRAAFPKINTNTLGSFPLPKFNQTQHDQIVQLVQTMLQLHAELPGASGAAKVALEKRIVTTDGQIDALVFRLYGLTDAEIALVSGV